MSVNAGFFAVGRETFVRACGLGDINPAVALLVLARGTGHDNRTTSWSAQAIEQHTGMAWRRGKAAIAALHTAKLLTLAAGSVSSLPRYKLDVSGPLIWLPNSIVQGVGDEIPPLAKLRQRQEVMTLRLFVELYSAQHLLDDGGIARDVTYRCYERREIGGRGAFTVWAYKNPAQYVVRSEVTEPHYRKTLTAEDKAKGHNVGTDFFTRFRALEQLGLVTFVPHLFEGPTGEALHELGEDEVDSATVTHLAREASESLLSEGQVAQLNDYDFVVPVQNHMIAAEVRDVARLRYRPQTKATAAWWGDYKARCAAFAEKYRAIAEQGFTAERAA